MSVAAALGFTSAGTAGRAGHRRRSGPASRKVYLGHDGPSGRSRRLEGPNPYPPSPHLAHGRDPPPARPAWPGEEARHVRQRCDELERLLVRKLVSKQPLPSGRHEHALSGCALCTMPAAAAKPGRYLYQRNVHRHTEQPNPPGPGFFKNRVVRPASERASHGGGPRPCPHLRKSTTLRGLDDMAGAGRLPDNAPPVGRPVGRGKESARPGLQHGAMQLPVQRTTARQQLRKAIVNFFGYFDADESGELSGAELRQVFARMINLEAGSSGSQQGLEFNTVLDALMRRYDENGDGEVTFGEIARRLLCVMEAPEGPPLPDLTPDPGAKGKRAEGGARAKADSQLLLERRVDRHESAWAARLAATSPTDLPRQLLRRVAKRLEQFDLDGNGHLETVELRRIMSDYMPALSEAEMECLVARYDPEGRGIVVAQAAARRICGLVTGPNRGSNRGGTKQQQQQQQQAPSEAQLRALTDRKLEDHLIGTLRSRMKTDTPAEARRVVKVLVSRFDDDADMDVPYASMLTCLKLLLHVDDRDAQKTAELKHLIRSLDRDRSGTVSQEELAARVFAGLRRAVGVANPSASSAASSAAAPWLVVEAEAARHSTEASLGELGGDAIFDAPDQKSALETRKRVRALASALQELVGARLRGGWSAPRALKATQQVFQPFASKLHPGTLVAANEDGTVDIALAGGEAPQTGAGGEAGGGAGLVVRGVAACAGAPKDHQANWVPKPQAEAADSGQGGGGQGGAAAYYKLKVGNLVEFRSGALLGRWDEFPTALRALFPRALESDLGLLAAKLARPQTRHAPGAGPAQSPVVALGDLARWLCKSARDEEARAARRR